MGSVTATRAVSSGYYIASAYIVIILWCVFDRYQVFKLVYNVHTLGITHQDLEPWNVVRTDDGKFLLIVFTQRRVHVREKCVAQHVHQKVVSKSLD